MRRSADQASRHTEADSSRPRLGLVAIVATAVWAMVASSAAANAGGGFDCNGYGLSQGKASPINYACAEVRRPADERFEDNGHYVGHDEPLVEYYSTTPGSGNNVQYKVRLPVDPTGTPDGKNGVPTGPAGPDDFTNASFTPDDQTLLTNPGDDLVVRIHDTAHGVETSIRDLTTHTRGFMIASAKNGFRHIMWDPVNFTCNGQPYDYHPMYSTSPPPASPGEPVAWAGWSAHTAGISASWEIGHFETPDAADDPGGEELPCFAGPTIPGCIGNDTDFDGLSYQPAWPDGSPNHATNALWSSPTSSHKGSHYTDPYPSVMLEADTPAIEATCDGSTGAGCTVPPEGAAFYPWPHTETLGNQCRWSVGNDTPDTINSFGGNPTTAWDPLELVDFGGGFTAYEDNANGPFANPC